MKAIYLSIALIELSTSAEFADSNNEKIIYRSRSGGAGMTERVQVGKQDANTKTEINKNDSTRAMPSQKLFAGQAAQPADADKDVTKKATKRVYLSHSGGSASTQYVDMPVK